MTTMLNVTDCAAPGHARNANFIAFLAQETKPKTVPYASLHRRLTFPPFAMPPAQPIERGFIYGTRFPSVVSSASHTADLRHSFINDLHRRAYQAETTDRWIRVTKDLPVLRVNHVTLESILPRVWEIVSSGAPIVKTCDGIKL